MNLDWKFIATLMFTLAGVLVPVWLWQVDQDAKALKLEVTSSTSIGGDLSIAFDGLKFTLDDQLVVKPYVSTLELQNSGSRPIQQSDFDSPIEITTNEPAKIIRTKIAQTTPLDIMPKLISTPQTVAIQPLLLNPKDRIQLAIISSGGEPQFSVRARIAGIRSIKFGQLTSCPRNSKKNWSNGIIGFLLLVIYAIAATLTVNGALTRSFKKFHLSLSIITCLGGTALLGPLEDDGAISHFQLNFIIFAAIFPATPYIIQASKSIIAYRRIKSINSSGSQEGPI